MMGYNSKEGIVMLIDAVKNKKLEEIDNDLARLIPRSVNLAPNDERCKHLANRIREFYFDGMKLSTDTMNEFVDLNTDYHFGILACFYAELHARYQNRYDITIFWRKNKPIANESRLISLCFIGFISSPMYFFRFSIDKDFNLYKKFAFMLMGLSDTHTFKGACHTDDIYYLFRWVLFVSQTGNLVQILFQIVGFVFLGVENFR